MDYGSERSPFREIRAPISLRREARAVSSKSTFATVPNI
jgi:hypothetical protein